MLSPMVTAQCQEKFSLWSQIRLTQADLLTLCHQTRWIGLMSHNPSSNIMTSHRYPLYWSVYPKYQHLLHVLFAYWHYCTSTAVFLLVTAGVTAHSQQRPPSLNNLSNNLADTVYWTHLAVPLVPKAKRYNGFLANMVAILKGEAGRGLL